MEHERVLSLDLGGFMLVLDGRPEAPGLFVSGSRLCVPSRNPSWEHHLKGATLVGIHQAGLDRVVIIEFERHSVYDGGPCLIHFELTGRNANIILSRKPDGRIIACLRRVGSRQNRYRTISPGMVYVPPPPSGLPPEQWHEAKIPPDPGPADLCRELEGMGPRAARTILARASEVGIDVASLLSDLAAELSSGAFPDWLREQQEPRREVEARIPGAAELEARLSRERRELLKKLSASEAALGSVEQPHTFRLWGNLILTGKTGLARGMEKAELIDYEGNRLVIPLKKALNPAENAARYFRKASGVHTERERIEGRIVEINKRLDEIGKLLNSIPELAPERIGELLRRPGKSAAPRRPREYILDGGWRCLAGRNARENEELTFRTAAREDYWLHARGAAGSHVILRRDGRPGNPPEKVVQQAADIAARHSGQKGIIPVDCTLVKYVRRVKGAAQGFVTYTNEKTLFATVE